MSEPEGLTLEGHYSLFLSVSSLDKKSIWLGFLSVHMYQEIFILVAAITGLLQYLDVVCTGPIEKQRYTHNPSPHTHTHTVHVRPHGKPLFEVF